MRERVGREEEIRTQINLLEKLKLQQANNHVREEEKYD